MPEVHRESGYRFFFYANEGSEAVHVHIGKGSSEAKFWLSPIRMAWNSGFKPAEIRKILSILQKQETKIVEEWNEFTKKKN